MKKLSTLSFGISILCVVLLLTFRVSKIVCLVADAHCSQELQDQLQTLAGKSLFLTDFESAISSSITDETVLFVSLQKELPSTLIVSLAQEKPVYILRSDEKNYTVYASGLIHEHKQESTNDYTVIAVEFPLEKIVENDHVLPKYHDELTKLSLSLYKPSFSLQNSRWIDTETIQLEVSSGIRVYIPFESATQKITILEAILVSPELETVSEPLTEIDLRYKYPVLRTTE
ncbi:MAG: hypothetical protein GW762_05050 [Candidatus Pacebacteria bacterium]|nr:hypothetical protein [Candidatus Paceibacterota bacterium]